MAGVFLLLCGYVAMPWYMSKRGTHTQTYTDTKRDGVQLQPGGPAAALISIQLRFVKLGD